MGMHEAIDPDVRESFPTVRDYLEGDSRAVPPSLFERSDPDLGAAPVDKRVFLSPEQAKLEEQHIWRKVWQFAARENDIPEVGDRTVYDILDQSFVIVRSAPDEIKAFYNACRHRGTRLVGELDPRGGREISCSFHNWTYHLDGSLKRIPCRWDFPGVRDEDVHLAEVKVAVWNGFIFLNMDPECEPFERFIGEPLPRHFRDWSYERAAKVVHIAKVLPCNWKIAMSAFMEVYHVNRTHANLLPYSGDCNTQYDVWGEHARQIMCIGVASPHLAGSVDQQMILEGLFESSIGNTFGADVDDIPELSDAADAGELRRVFADIVRASMKQRLGIDYSGASDAEMIDAIHYMIFPNMFVFGGKAIPLCYRVKPILGDHESCQFEVMALVNIPDGQPMPKDVDMMLTPRDEPWGARVDVLGRGAEVFDQDQANLVKFQAGLRQDGLTHIHLARYQERNIRNLLDSVQRRIEAGQARERAAG